MPTHSGPYSAMRVADALAEARGHARALAVGAYSCRLLTRKPSRSTAQRAHGGAEHRHRGEQGLVAGDGRRADLVAVGARHAAARGVHDDVDLAGVDQVDDVRLARLLRGRVLVDDLDGDAVARQDLGGALGRDEAEAELLQAVGRAG